MAARTQEPLKVPVLFETSANVPVGVMNVPGEVSATVTLQVDAWPIVIGPEQLIVVVLARLLIVILAVPELVL